VVKWRTGPIRTAPFEAVDCVSDGTQTLRREPEADGECALVADCSVTWSGTHDDHAAYASFTGRSAETNTLLPPQALALGILPATRACTDVYRA